MYATASTTFGVQTAGIFIHVPNVDAAYVAALTAGAISLMPIADAEYDRTCGVLDPWGNNWWITEPPLVG